MMIILIHHWLREFSPVCGKPFSQHHNASEPWRGLKSLLPRVQWGSSKHNDVAKPLVRLFRVEACDQSSCMACWNASHAWQMCWASGSFKVTQKGAPVASSWSLLGHRGYKQLWLLMHLLSSHLSSSLLHRGISAEFSKKGFFCFCLLPCRRDQCLQPYSPIAAWYAGLIQVRNKATAKTFSILTHLFCIP